MARALARVGTRLPLIPLDTGTKRWRASIRSGRTFFGASRPRRRRGDRCLRLRSVRSDASRAGRDGSVHREDLTCRSASELDAASGSGRRFLDYAGSAVRADHLQLRQLPRRWMAGRHLRRSGPFARWLGLHVPDQGTESRLRPGHARSCVLRCREDQHPPACLPVGDVRLVTTDASP